MHDFLFRWQQLIGSMLGAATPLVVLLLSSYLEKKNTYRRDLILLEKYLVLNANQISDTKSTLEKFSKEKLGNLLKNVEERILDGKTYSADMAFLPLFEIHPIEKNIYSINTGSGYLDNLVLQTYKLSSDLISSIDDIRVQFNTTIEVNRTMSFQKLNPPPLQNRDYKENLTNLKKEIDDVLIGINFEVYTRTLHKTINSLRLLNSIGLTRWQLRFSSKYRFFISRKQKHEYDKKAPERIEKYLLDNK